MNAQTSSDDRALRLRNRRSARLDLRERARVLDPSARVAKCGLPLGGPVAVRGVQGEHASFVNLSTCGSVWACPVCAAKINARRSQEIRRGIENWAQQGGDVAMLTLTMRHRAGQRLSDLWDALSSGWRAVVSSSAWTNKQTGDRVRFGVEGYLRTVECTYSSRNGWHLHAHVLLFVEHGAFDMQADREEFADRVFDRWRAALVKKGLEAPLRHDRNGKPLGVDLRVLEGDGVASAISEYLSKMSNGLDAASDTALDLSPQEQARLRREHAAAMRQVNGMAFEASRSDLKVGNSEKGKTPFELLGSAVEAVHHPDHAAWQEAYAKAQEVGARVYRRIMSSATRLHPEIDNPGPSAAEMKASAEMTKLAEGLAAKIRDAVIERYMKRTGLKRPASDIWNEWVRGSKGRRQQVWSRGLRQRLGLDPEESDAEVAAKEPEGEDLFDLDRDTYNALRKTRGALGRVLTIAEVSGRGAVDIYLGSLGLPPTRDPSHWRPSSDDIIAFERDSDSTY